MFRLFLCVWALKCMCLCVLTALSLPYSNYSPPRTPLRSPFFFCPQIPLIRISCPVPVVVHQACCVSPTLVCTFVTTHITAGPCVCLVRGFQFPYITLWTLVLSDFGLHNCVSNYASVIQRISGLAETEHHTLLKLAEVQASFPDLEGQQVYVCKLHCLWWARASFVHRSMQRTRLLQPDRHTERYRSQISANLCLEIQMKQFLRSKINPHASRGQTWLALSETRSLSFSELSLKPPV